MIHLTTISREAAEDFANQLARKCRIDVYVYQRLDDERFFVLDDEGFSLEIKRSSVLKTVYNPERRASTRVSCNAYVQGQTIGHVGHA